MHGSCLCGAVHYEIKGSPRSVVGCHCVQCRKTSGHYVAATRIMNDHLEVRGEDFLTWYQSSPTAKRGFCKTCGSQLFWREVGASRTSIMAGTIDGETNLVMDQQIHTCSKGDYYDLPVV